MFSHGEWSQILQRLLDLTLEGTVKWSENGSNGYFFEVNDEVTYVLGSQDDDGQPPYELRINRGTTTQYRTLGTIDTVDVTAENDVRAALFSLWEAAQRSANDAPAVASELLMQLEQFGTNKA